MADWVIVAVRLGIYTAITTQFGLSAFSLYGLRTGERSDALPLRRWLLASAGLGILLSLCWVTLTASVMAGTPLWPIDQAAIGALLSGSEIGTAWNIRLAALALAGVAALLVKGQGVWLALVALASGVALSTLAWTGHGAMDEGAIGWLHLVADILHLVFAGIWIGALLGLILLISRSDERVNAAHLELTHHALHGFGAVGTIVVATIVITGVVNSWLLVGIANVATLGTTLYGVLLVAKLVLFGVMLGLASLNRFRLTPAFERSIAADDHDGALAALRRSLVLETTCAIVILALVAWLGTLSPPASSM